MRCNSFGNVCNLLQLTEYTIWMGLDCFSITSAKVFLHLAITHFQPNAYYSCPSEAYLSLCVCRSDGVKEKDGKIFSVVRKRLVLLDIVSLSMVRYREISWHPLNANIWSQAIERVLVTVPYGEREGHWKLNVVLALCFVCVFRPFNAPLQSKAYEQQVTALRRPLPVIEWGHITTHLTLCLRGQ